MDGSGASGQLGFLLFEAGMDHAFNSEGNRAEDLESPSVPRWESSGRTGTHTLEALLDSGGSGREKEELLKRSALYVCVAVSAPCSVPSH